jgi:hypothetical protein
MLLVPFLTTILHYVDVKPLQGAVIIHKDTTFSFKGWFDGGFQTNKEHYLNDNFGFRNIFVRFNNQLSYWIFHKAKAKGVVVGKENYLYESSYIDGYTGRTFIGEKAWQDRMSKIKFIQDALQRMDKTLILILAPGKASFFPEYIPNSLLKGKSTSNYDCASKLAKEMNINCIDFNDYFNTHKGKMKYALYPRLGVHWSYYGYTLATDSIIKYIEKKRNIQMPHLYWKEVEMDFSRDQDDDAAKAMNLLFNLPTEKLAYPKVLFESDKNKTKPNVLAVTDSYYWGPYSMGISKAFGLSHFWFYYREAYPESFTKESDPTTFNLKDEIDKHDVFILMATEATLDKLGWHFIENVYDLFRMYDNKNYDFAFWNKVIKIKDKMRSDQKWSDYLMKKAQDKGIPLDSMMTLDAIWTINNEK